MNFVLRCLPLIGLFVASSVSATTSLQELLEKTSCACAAGWHLPRR